MKTTLNFDDQLIRTALLTRRGQPVAGVNLDDRDALYERMDAPGRKRSHG